MISNGTDLIFFQPRTGSHAVNAALENRGWRSIGPYHGVCDVSRFRNVASVVRHHLTAHVSWYYQQPHPQTLEPPRLDGEWVRKLWARDDITEYFAHPSRLYWKYRLLSNFVLRYENLLTDLNLFLHACEEAPVAELPDSNRSKFRRYAGWEHYLTRDAVQAIVDRYGSEMTELNYGTAGLRL